MKFLDRLLGKKEQPQYKMVEDEIDNRAKGFTAVSVDTISKKLGEKGRFMDMSDLLDYLEEIENTFVVTKNGNILGRFDEFPSFDTIMDDFHAKWGGGVYQVKCLAPKSVRLGSYRLDGEEKDPIGDGEAIGKKKDQKRKFDNPEDEIFYRELENNPKYKEMYMRNVLKVKGLKDEDESKKEKKKSLEEIIAEKVEANPQLVDKLVEAEIEKRVGRVKQPKEQTPLERAQEMAEYWASMKEIFGDKQEGTDWGSVIKEFVKQGGIGEVISAAGAVMAAEPSVVQKPKVVLQKPPTVFIPEEEKQSLIENTKYEREIGETGGVLMITKEQPVVNSAAQAELEQFALYLPTISSFIGTVSPEQAFQMLNQIKPEYCDMLYDIDINTLNSLIKKMNEKPEIKGTLSKLMTEESQSWLKSFLMTNKEEIDKETGILNGTTS